MKQSFDFDNIPRRMPYRVPYGTFTEIDSTVGNSIGIGKRKWIKSTVIRWTGVAIIAFLISAFLFMMIKPVGGIKDGYLEQIDMAYANLSDADQDFLEEIYSEDIFINQP